MTSAAHLTEHRIRFGRPLQDGGSELTWRGPALMGIVNVTPDSFSDGGVHQDHGAAVDAAIAMHEAGAMLIDVGGESTRPGADEVPASEEIRRVSGVVEALADRGVLVSIDTRKPDVARAALEAGARVVNDVGGLADPAMREVCAEFGAPAIAMHMQGEPRTMQRAPHYQDVVEEVASVLVARRREALADGVPDVLLDPGIGFGKTAAHNVALLDGLERLTREAEVVVGASRKRTIDTLAGAPDPGGRLPGTLALHLFAARRGAAMLRVHDVPEHDQALRVWAALQEAEAVHRAEPDDRAEPAHRAEPVASAPLDSIRLDGMEFHAYHGVYEEEGKLGARFVVDVELGLRIGGRDSLKTTVDYGRVYDIVRRAVTEERRYRLIEALASRIADTLLAVDELVERVTVRVHKPHAPLPGVVRDVSVEVHRSMEPRRSREVHRARR
ncbi:MAG: dihydropteroate synthase [Trueperaceae bacterium]